MTPSLSRSQRLLLRKFTSLSKTPMSSSHKLNLGPCAQLFSTLPPPSQLLPVTVPNTFNQIMGRVVAKEKRGTIGRKSWSSGKDWQSRGTKNRERTKTGTQRTSQKIFARRLLSTFGKNLSIFRLCKKSRSSFRNIDSTTRPSLLSFHSLIFALNSRRSWIGKQRNGSTVPKSTTNKFMWRR